MTDSIQQNVHSVIKPPKWRQCHFISVQLPKPAPTSHLCGRSLWLDLLVKESEPTAQV